MTIHLKLFAGCKDIIGVSSLSIELADGSDATATFDALIQRHPGLERYRNSALLAVNRAYTDRATVLRDGDELAIIPPVSGGICEEQSLLRLATAHPVKGNRTS